ncbi:Symplekin [Rhynchospora pubera]|uniref:Symplekin n=1 Tax=Rhynchospora pubera TaxID=906938 RepID=A0AAV8FU40_9POAL|nr:Symplekin [Rhynchospora pubera]
MELEKWRGGGMAMPEGSLRFDSSRALRFLEDVGPELTEDIVVLMPTLISFLRHADPLVVKKSVTCGTVLIAGVLQEIAFQINSFGRVDRWLEEMWSWMVQFKDFVSSLLSESVSIGAKTAVLKFLETCVLLFTPHSDATGSPGKGFNIVNIPRGYCRFLDPVLLESDGIKALNLLLDTFHSSYSLHGTLIITSINCLVAIAKKRPIYYERVLSELLGFYPSINSIQGAHSSSIRFNLRAGLLGFLRSTNPSMVESRDKLIMALRGLSPGESTEQIIRQVEKMSRNLERPTRDNFRSYKDEHPPPAEDPISRKRGSTLLIPEDLPSKRARSDESDQNETNSELTPAGKMIAVIGALIAEGERGVGPLELLISNIHADLMADIVIETMQQLPKSLPVSSPRTQVPAGALTENPLGTGDGTEGKRDPRRDPRRLDPRRPAGPMGSTGTNNIQSQVNTDIIPADSHPVPSSSSLASRLPPSLPLSEPNFVETAANVEMKIESELKPLQDFKLTDVTETLIKEGTEIKTEEITRTTAPPPDLTYFEQDAAMSTPSDHNSVESDRLLQGEKKDSLMEDASASSGELPVFPLCFELNEREKREACQMAIRRIIDGKSDYHLQLLSRMIALNDPEDEILGQIQKHIFVDFHRHKGHELALHLLYHLKAAMAMDSSSGASDRYEKFLLSLARALLDNLPSTDKSFNRLLGDAPLLPDSAFHLLEELCGGTDGRTHKEREIDGGDRVTQGLGTVWSLILGRPSARMACLDIALKCAIHSQDEVRSKAIRLVVNKLYLLSYASLRIEEFATNKLLSIVHDQSLEMEVDQTTSRDAKVEIMNQESSVTSSQSSEPGFSENESGLVLGRLSGLSLSQAQTQISLFFALCSKKPSLLRVVFDVYGKTPKAVKQAIHRHLPVLLRNLDSCSELLDIIYNLPEGSENLITLVLQVLTEESTPSADLIGAVKHLYFTKLKDPVILIPMLSSLSKEEVMPIFPRLLELPLDKFQAALARILQGSAHTGPALTPTEVLIAIHDINPEKDRVALKKVTDACTACFEQRTVFTQQVLAKALNQMVEKTPLPLLFMRTVIQTIDAFPSLVDFVMSLLSKLVSKQIWKMPKLYAGFLKCVYQTQPHSFPVLLELPFTQLENVLVKHANLRAPLAAYVINKNIHATLPGQTLKILGLLNEPQQTTPKPFDSGASIQGATLT